MQPIEMTLYWRERQEQQKLRNRKRIHPVRIRWFAIYTAEKDIECPILIISMVEDVKGRGGSGYVVKKDSLVLEEWFSSH